jgi:hypothetical protein
MFSQNWEILTWFSQFLGWYIFSITFIQHKPTIGNKNPNHSSTISQSRKLWSQYFPKSGKYSHKLPNLGITKIFLCFSNQPCDFDPAVVDGKELDVVKIPLNFWELHLQTN